MWELFFAAFAAFVMCSAIYIKNSAAGNLPRNFGVFTYGASAVLVLISAAERVFSFGSFGGAFMILGLAIIAEFCLYFTPHQSRTTKFAAKLLLAAVIAELTVFQLPSYRLILGDYPHTVLTAAQAEIENGSFDPSGGVAVNGTAEVSMTYRGLNRKIGSVCVNARFKDAHRQVNFFADVTEETGYYYRLKLIDEKFISDCEPSHYASVQTAGKSDAVRFRFSGVSDEDGCVIESIELNREIPFDVMPLRTLLIVLFGTFVYACVFSPAMEKSCRENAEICRKTAIVLTCIAVFCIGKLVLVQIPDGGLADRFRLTSGDQITEELVNAFEQLRVDLPYEPGDALKNMENPYDTGARHYGEVECLWDHSYYNGKYYSYYGIAPLLLFLPYHLISGYYFPTDIAVLLFSAGGLVLLSLLYSAVVRRFFGDISTGAYISGLVVLLAACGIWFAAGRPMFYEIAISSGFVSCLAGVYLLVTSGTLTGDKIKSKNITFSSIFLGLAVMCRPTLALYALCGCAFYAYGVYRLRASKAEAFKYAVGAYLPLVLLGFVQMMYNYMRFGSPFEFGLKYSLTINDFTHTEFHLRNMLVGVYNFLFAPPAFIPEYPFVSAPFSFLGINGFYYKDNGNASGLLFLALPLFGYLLGGRALKALPNDRARLKWGGLIGLGCVVMPAAIVCAAWDCGYAVRYMADFSWQLILGSLVTLFYLYTKSGNGSLRKVFTAAMSVCAVYSVITAGTEAFAFAFPYEKYPDYAELLTRFFL